MPTKARDYKKEYRDFHGKPKNIKKRSMVNKARRKLKLKKGDPREASHIVSPLNGGTNAKSNLRRETKQTNNARRKVSRKKQT